MQTEAANSVLIHEIAPTAVDRALELAETDRGLTAHFHRSGMMFVQGSGTGTGEKPGNSRAGPAGSLPK